MKKILRRLVTLLLVTVIPATVLVAVMPAPPAQAATKYTRNNYVIPAAHWSFATVAARGRIDAMNNSGTVLNYAKLITAFRPVVNTHETEWRRQFAAGVRVFRGSRFTNISAAENNAINATIRKYYGTTCPQCRIFKAESAQRATCTGRSDHIQHQTKIPSRGKYSTTYLNSCAVNNLRTLYAVAGLTIGGAGAWITFSGQPLVGGLVISLATIIGINERILTNLQDNSQRYKAVYYVTSDVRTIENANGTCCRRIENVTWYSQQ